MGAANFPNRLPQLRGLRRIISRGAHEDAEEDGKVETSEYHPWVLAGKKGCPESRTASFLEIAVFLNPHHSQPPDEDDELE